MARVTSGEVQSILIDAYDGVTSLTPFITAANLTISLVVTRASAKGISIDDTTAKEMERWVSAHNYVMADRQLQQEVRGKASGSYQGKTGMGLDASMYGQQAIILDPSGELRKIGKGRATLTWGGKAESAAMDYESRN